MSEYSGKVNQQSCKQPYNKVGAILYNLDFKTISIYTTERILRSYFNIFHFYIAPYPPLNVNANTINSTAVRVNWNPPDITNGIIRYYTVVYRLNDSSVTMELNSTDVTVVVSNLDPFNYYVFYVLAFTVASSDPSENDTALTAEAGNTKTTVIVYAVYIRTYLHYNSYVRS